MSISSRLGWLYARAEPHLPVFQVSGRNNAARPASGTDELVRSHFASNSSLDHPCYESLRLAISMLGGKAAMILETGSAAWGTNSSLLFDAYVQSFGGAFHTIDLRPNPSLSLKSKVSPKTTMYVGDSVRVMRQHEEKWSSLFDLVYLDSFDLDLADPLPSMVHCLREFALAERMLKPGGLLLIDDTPRTTAIAAVVFGPAYQAPEQRSSIELVPGKGALLERLVDRDRWEVVFHEYQLLLRRTF